MDPIFRICSFVGISALREHILQWSWKKFYQSEVPKLEKTVSLRKQQAHKEIEEFETLLNTLNLRKLAGEHASRFIQVVQLVLSGTSKGNPTANGETLKEEVDKQLFGTLNFFFLKNNFFLI